MSNNSALYPLTFLAGSAVALGVGTVVRVLSGRKPAGNVVATKSAKYGGERGPELRQYLVDHGVRSTPELDELHAETMQLGRISGMCSPPDSIAILQMCVHLTHAKKVLEVGVFTGYTALGMALALPEGGKIIACDIDPKWPAIGKKYWERAGVANRIQLHLGPATATLNACLNAGQAGTFDMGFIDADKANYDTYYELLLQLIRPGGLIIIDNVLWGGRVLDSAAQDEDTRAIRALNTKVKGDQRVHICTLANSDGITLAYKK